LLQLAACLGSAFDKRMLDLAWHNHYVSSDYKDLNLDNLIEEALNEKFLEVESHGKYRLVHDNVQEAAMSLIPAEKFATFQHNLGMILVRELKEDELSDAIFVVVNLLNHQLDNIQGGDVELARLNLQAAVKAKASSAFVSASKYASYGISCLPPDAWEHHSGLSLSLYSIGSEMEGTQGNTEAMQEYSRQVLEQGKADLFDKLRVYNVMIESKAKAGHTKEAINLCLDVLAKLGCKFPRSEGGRAFRAISTIVKLKRKDAIPTKENIDCLEKMSDRTKIESMRLMQRLATYCFTSGNAMLMILVSTRQARWTLRYGLDTWSPLAFIGY
jgi:histidine kinase